MFRIDDTPKGFKVVRIDTAQEIRTYPTRPLATDRGLALRNSVSRAQRAFSELFEAGQHSGVMIGIFFSEQTVEDLRLITDSEENCDHITLVYLGDVTSIPDINIAGALMAAQYAARMTPALRGNIGGVGRFHKADGDQDAIYLSVDVPGLAQLRQTIMTELGFYGVQPDTDHDYTPHVTVEYVKAGSDHPLMTATQIERPILIDSICVAVSDKRVEFKLTGDTSEQFGDFPAMFGIQGNWRLFTETSLNLLPDWVPYLPTPHTFTHPEYGDVIITEEGNRLFVENFKKGIYQNPIPLDAEHETKLSGAVGWIHELRMNGDGSVDALVKWTPRGTALVSGGAYKYISPEWFSYWIDPATGEAYENVAVGGAITTRPFFKSPWLRPMLASEAGMYAGSTGDDRFFVSMSKQETQAMTTKTQEAPAVISVEQFNDMQAKLTAFSEQLTQATERANQAETRAKKFEEDLAAAQSTIGQMESDNQAARFTQMASMWPGQTEVHVGILQMLAQQYGEDSPQFAAYVEMQNGMANQTQTAELFREKGSGNSDKSNGDVESQINALVTKAMSENPNLSAAEAGRQVARQNPALYQRYSETVRQKV